MKNIDDIEINSEALIHASKLRNSNIQRRQLKENITDIIRRIGQEISVSHREGKHNITTTLPITFNISNMSYTDSKRYVYAAIIKELEKKGYSVLWINPNKDRCEIKITWMRPEDINEIDQQVRVIKKYLKKS